ncbi:unnamed protein product [Scytosiphon promiscuus]
MPNAAAEQHKAAGNSFFKTGDYRNAIAKYSDAIAADPTNHTYWSNRSASYAGLNEWEDAARDAAECIKVNKNFVKGYFRLATAKKNLNEYDAAADVIKRGLCVEPRNADLKKNLKEIDELIRGEKVAGLVSQAEAYLKAGDYGAAMRAADSGMRMDAGNRDLQAVLDRAKPKFEALERSRRSGLSSTELLKEKGDDFYKKAAFEDAIVKYSECLDSLPDKRSPLAIKCFSNRSACYKQLSNFDATVADTTSVLEVEPENVKALVPVRTAGCPVGVVDASGQGGFRQPVPGQRDAAPPQQGSPAAQERQLSSALWPASWLARVPLCSETIKTGMCSEEEPWRWSACGRVG